MTLPSSSGNTSPSGLGGQISFHRRKRSTTSSGIEKPSVHSAAHEMLDLRRRDPQPGGVVGPIFRDQRAGDIVAVARALLYCIARRHPIAVAIKQHASEEARLASISIIVALGRVAATWV